MIKIFALLIVVIMGTAAGLAEARMSWLEIIRREPFAGGQAFGETGPYEKKIVGRFHGELDLENPLNSVIVDLDKAPRNSQGRVEYAADFYILKPVDVVKGNGAVLYDVSNRGGKPALGLFNNAPPGVNDPTTQEHAGNGFLMRHGFTVVWSGWIPTGLPAGEHILRIVAPVATSGSGPIEGLVWDEILVNTKTVTEARLTFRATSPDSSKATLLIRDRIAASPTTVPASQWEFINDQTIRLLPAGTPFRLGAVYQVIYRAANPPVAGIGFAATRDLISFFRYQTADDRGTGNPLSVGGTPALRRTLAFGQSQSGRYLRGFVYHGFNEDERNRIVFDGIHSNIAAARVFLNYRFAQAVRGNQLAHENMFYPDVDFPFAYESQADPITGKTDGIFSRCAMRGNCPKLIHTVSSNEYWQSGQSLVTTDPLGSRDSTPPENVRIYLTAGTQHVLRQNNPKGICSLPTSPVDYRPVLRALVLALDRWVKDGTLPPPSRYPRIEDRTLVAASAIGFPKIPGIQFPSGPNPKRRVDYGFENEKGIINKVVPEYLSKTYPVLVPRVDSDGNEIAGIRLPDVAVPTGTATGWALRAPDVGGAGELCTQDGSFIPFAKTKTEREDKGDPRLSIEERYRDKADFVAKVRNAALALERGGYLLAEDVKHIADKAAALIW